MQWTIKKVWTGYISIALFFFPFIPCFMDKRLDSRFCLKRYFYCIDLIFCAAFYRYDDFWYVWRETCFCCTYGRHSRKGFYTVLIEFKGLERACRKDPGPTLWMKVSIIPLDFFSFTSNVCICAVYTPGIT
jgi:hypothetical protein